jgi:DNA-directed RNA polymerase subunit M/transcription elongation factor TFIIS
MSRINDKLGLRPAATRSMMKLPSDRELRARLTSAKCPQCDSRGAILCAERGRTGDFTCTRCYHVWTPEVS